jgi:hypothetical protein
VTWDVYRAGLDKGQIRLKDRMGQMRDVPVNFQLGEKSAVEMTLF